MTYVCKSLSWSQAGGLVLELMWVPASPETEEFLSPDTTALRPRFRTVTIPVVVEQFHLPMVAFVQYMLRLIASLTPPDMESLPREQLSTALICLASNVLSSSSTRVYTESFTQEITV
jgi:hypothetical protein